MEKSTHIILLACGYAILLLSAIIYKIRDVIKQKKTKQYNPQ